MKLNIRSFRIFLTGNVLCRGYSASTHKAMVLRAYSAVQAFYIVNLFYAYQTMYTLMDIYSDATNLTIDPLWPVWFVDSAHITLAANAFCLSYMAFSLMAAFSSQFRFIRLLVFLSCLEVFAFKYSFGPLPEKEHMWIWISLIFTLLPSGKASSLVSCRDKRQHYLDLFSGAQGLVLFFYTLSGLWKIAYGIVALGTENATGLFSLHTLSRMVSNLMIHEHYETFLGPLLIVHPISGCLLYILTIYIESCAILIWFRPSLHKLWAFLLIVFHIGTWLLMGIPFYLQPPLLAILLFQSPFIHDSHSWKITAKQIPLFGWLLFKRVN